MRVNGIGPFLRVWLCPLLPGKLNASVYQGILDNPVEKKQHMLVRYVLKHAWLSWFKLALSRSCAGPKQLAPAQDQLRTSK